MKNSFIIVGLAFFFIQFSDLVLGEEIGFTSGVKTQYSGEIELQQGEYEDIDALNSPFSIYVLSGHKKLSYLHYEQYAKKIIGSSLYAAVIKTNVLILSYQRSFFSKNEEYYDFSTKSYQKGETEAENSNFDMYWNAGIGLFNSSYNDLFITGSLFDPGFVFGIGGKKHYKKFFFGFEGNYIVKKVQYKTFAYYYDIEVDIGGLIVSFVTGVKF